MEAGGPRVAAIRTSEGYKRKGGGSKAGREGGRDGGKEVCFVLIQLFTQMDAIAHGGRTTTGRNWSSPSTMWVLGSEVRFIKFGGKCLCSLNRLTGP